MVIGFQNSFDSFKSDYKLATGKDPKDDLNLYLSYLKTRLMEKQIEVIDELNQEIHKLESTIDTLKNRVDDLTEKMQ
jgi:uncharacterized coiled-coil protein SlyX